LRRRKSAPLSDPSSSSLEDDIARARRRARVATRREVAQTFTIRRNLASIVAARPRSRRPAPRLHARTHYRRHARRRGARIRRRDARDAVKVGESKLLSTREIAGTAPTRAR
jgi:hypothetical protein